MNREVPRTEPCRTPQVNGYDWDNASGVLMEKEREEKIAVSVKQNEADRLID